MDCTTCRYRRKRSTFPRCFTCVKTSKIGAQFPGYEAGEAEPPGENE